MIVYTKSCLPCTHAKQWRNLKAYTQENGLEIEQRRVTRNPEWKAEAEQYGIDLPFVVHNGVALSLNEPLERLEEL